MIFSNKLPSIATFIPFLTDLSARRVDSVLLEGVGLEEAPSNEARHEDKVEIESLQSSF